jgi:hypothetical protein
LKGYRNEISDLINDLDAIDLIVIPREQNSKADELAVAYSTLQLPDSLIDENISVEVIFRPLVSYISVEVIFRPLVPNNVDHWQVFDDDKQVIMFLTHIHEFSDLGINMKRRGL